MRILNIRFKNLNSLTGEWFIDLSDPAYRTQGLFAITGPTGAGKSTLLDAICLALYGRTPRLPRVNKSGNEILSRRTGECFAEVTFETQAGTFRSHWSQTRARRKPDGELQMPRHEISDAKTGEVLESKIRDVAERMVKVTGMDFDRFTRSMLLAQGGFAAFLQAAPEDRAQILEQITGTEIYSQISILVHERHTEERRQLEMLTAELEGMRPLSGEAVLALEETLARQTEQDGVLQAKLMETASALSWLETISRLESEKSQLAERTVSLSERRLSFAPEAHRLSQALRALESAADASALETLRALQQQEQEALQLAQAQLPASEEALLWADDQKKQRQADMDQKKSELDSLLPLLQQARHLDVVIREKREPLRDAESALEEKNRALHAVARNLQALREDREKSEETLQRQERQMVERASDEALVSTLAGIQARQDQAETVNRQWQLRLQDAREAEVRLRNQNAAWKALAARQQAVLEKWREEMAAITSAREAQQLLLEGEALPALRNRGKQLADACRDAGQQLLLARVITEKVALLEGLETRMADLGEREAKVGKELSQLSHEQELREREIVLLEERVLLLHQIADLAQARERLQEGKPCPLCGSLTHPYSSGKTPPQGEAQLALEEARRNGKSLQERILSGKQMQASLTAETRHVMTERQSVFEALVSAEEQMNGLLQETGSTPAEEQMIISQPESIPAVANESGEKTSTPAGLIAAKDYVRAMEMARRQENGCELSHSACREALQILNARLEEAEEREERLARLREDLDKAREAKELVDAEVRGAAEKLEQERLNQERLIHEARVFEAELDRLTQTLAGEVAAFRQIDGIPGQIPDRLEWLRQGVSMLAERQSFWQALYAEHQQLAQTVKLLKQQDGQLAEQEALLQSDCTQLQRQVETMRNILETTLAERQALLPEPDLDAVEQAAQQALQRAGQLVDQAEQAYRNALQQRDGLKQRVADMAAAVGARAERLLEQETGFLQHLRARGFADEEAWQSARLPEEERTRLAQVAQSLEQEAHLIASRSGEVVRQLAAEQVKAVTAESKETLQALQGTLAGHRTALLQEMGETRARIRTDRELRERQTERVAAMEAQRRESDRWSRLHALIGSADGKKYRNFAQGLTFDMMIRHANRQLGQLTDRYLLTRNREEPLELQVIDLYQAGETRSTKNLSGGESFLVSLSLALGLSRMASRRVRVDSLFLDEGFGTLDEETLSSALETLASLQRDGKLIGVISHVGALKERIPTQIQVTPQANGQSSLSGPGCRRGPDR